MSLGSTSSPHTSRLMSYAGFTVLTLFLSGFAHSLLRTEKFFRILGYIGIAASTITVLFMLSIGWTNRSHDDYIELSLKDNRNYHLLTPDGRTEFQIGVYGSSQQVLGIVQNKSIPVVVEISNERISLRHTQEPEGTRIYTVDTNSDGIPDYKLVSSDGITKEFLFDSIQWKENK